jgi:hypothetical protein
MIERLSEMVGCIPNSPEYISCFIIYYSIRSGIELMIIVFGEEVVVR